MPAEVSDERPDRPAANHSKHLYQTYNGYVLEQLCSPLVVHTTPAHGELLALVPKLVTRPHAHHYLTSVSPRRSGACSTRSAPRG
jgi:hypothetical protein